MLLYELWQSINIRGGWVGGQSVCVRRRERSKEGTERKERVKDRGMKKNNRQGG